MKISNWISSFSFKQFRQKTGLLSDAYWTQQILIDSIAEKLKNENQDAKIHDVMNCSFDVRMYPQTVSEFLTALPNFMNQYRLQLLVTYSAHLEMYLKDITFRYLISKGYVENLEKPKEILKLNKLGKVIGSPIINNSTIPDMIDYASELFEIDFGSHVTEWKKLYTLRCAAAHNGGIATASFIQKIGGSKQLALNPKENDNIGLTWEELRKGLRYGDEIVTMIDNKIASYEIRLVDAEIILRELKAKNCLPIKEKVPAIFNNEYSIFPVKRADWHRFYYKFF